MAFVFEDEQPTGGQFVFEDEAPKAQKSVNMEQAVGRKLPPVWDAAVFVEGQPLNVRGVYTPDAGEKGAYLVGMRDGSAAYIKKEKNGTLSLQPYKGKINAAGTDFENFAAGAGKAIVDTKRGIQQIGALAGNTLGLVDDETVDQSFADAKAVRARDADLMDTKAGIGGNLAGNVGTAMLGGGLVKGAGQGIGSIAKVTANAAPRASTAASVAGNALSRAGGAILAPKTYGQAAAVGAGMGLVGPAESLEDKALQTVAGGVAGVAGQGIAKGIGRLGKGAESIRQEVRDLASVAKNKWGINIRNDQLIDSPKLNAVASVLEETAGTGAAAAKENQQKQFNIALARTLGETSDNPIYAMNQAKARLSKAFEDTLTKNRVTVDDEFLQGMQTVVGQANKNLKPSEAGIIRNQVDDILSKVMDDGRIDGKALYNIKRDLDQIGDRNSNEAFHALELKKQVMEALNRSLGPDEAAKFTRVRTQYKNLLDLQKLKNRDAAGDISPARLGNFRGELTDDLNELAAIAQTFLRPKTGNSGTAVRLRSDTNILNIPVRAGELAGGLTVGRAANAALDSPKIGRLMLEGSKTARKLEPIGRAAPVILPAFLKSYLSSQ